MPDGLAAFLAERLNEAEAIARAAIQAGDGTWTQGTSMFDPGVIRAGDASISGDDLFIAKDGDNDIGLAHAVFIAANDPARELRAITAKRAILAEHPVTGHGGHLMCDRCVNPYDPAGDELHRWVRYPCPTIRHLAAEWADHPAYQPEWSPEPAGYDALKRSVATLEAQVALLMRTAQANGDVSINAIRTTLGLPAFPEDP